MTHPELPGESALPVVFAVDRHDAWLRWRPPHLGYTASTRHAVQVMRCEDEWETPHRPLSLEAAMARDAANTAAGCRDHRLEHTCSMKVTCLLPNTKYRFRVRSINESGSGPWSELSALIVTATGPPEPPPQPRILQVLHNAVHVQWKASANDGGTPIREYVVAAEPLHDFGPRVEHACSGLPLVGGWHAAWLKGLVEGTEYVVCVCAVNIHGFSEASPPSASFRPKALRTASQRWASRGSEGSVSIVSSVGSSLVLPSFEA